MGAGLDLWYLGVFPAWVRVTVMPKFDQPPISKSVLQPMFDVLQCQETGDMVFIDDS